MNILAVLALIGLLVLMFRWLGPPVRRSDVDDQRPKHNPEEDVPPPTLMG